MKLSAEQADATVQGNDVNNICSRIESAEKNSVVNCNPLLNYTEQAQSSTPITSEYHVLLAAAASLGDELLSINDTSSNENEIIKLNPIAVSEQSESVGKNISQLKSTLDSTKSKILKKSEKNRAKKFTEFLPDDSKNESESDDLDSKQLEKLAVLASSNLVPRKVIFLKSFYSKSIIFWLICNSFLILFRPI